MTYSLTWMPSVLEAAGLKVALVDGWSNRGHGDLGQTLGVMCHHTAGPKRGNMPSLQTLIQGRSDLSGPLAQLGLGRDGTFYVIAAGRCHHAGAGEWKGITTGNTNFIAIEAENSGLPDDSPWPPVQIDSFQRGVAALLAHINRSVEFCVGHKEYALPKGRKPDPNLDMVSFRASVSAILTGAVPAPVLIPAIEPVTRAGLASGRPTLRRGALGEWVKHIQAQCGVKVDGHFGANTEAALREFQRSHGLVPDGIVGPKTWKVLDQFLQ